MSEGTTVFGSKDDAAVTDPAAVASVVALLKGILTGLTGGSAADPSIVAGAVADNGVASGNPVPVGGDYNSTLPTYVTGDRATMQVDANGKVHVVPAGSSSAGADGVSNTGNMLSGAASNGTAVVLRVFARGEQFNGATWDRDRKPNAVKRLVSALGTTNADFAKASAGDLFRASGYNANAAARYLKLYNKASAPVVGTDVPVWTEYLAPQAKFELAFPKGLYFSTGIAFALTTGSADADTGALTAADVLALNLAYA